jgi:hypothetical protein
VLSRKIPDLLGKIPRPSPALGVALLALMVAASGVTVGAVPSNGTISACWDKKSGLLRVINTEIGQTCTSKETPLGIAATSAVSDEATARQQADQQQAQQIDSLQSQINSEAQDRHDTKSA